MGVNVAIAINYILPSVIVTLLHSLKHCSLRIHVKISMDMFETSCMGSGHLLLNWTRVPTSDMSLALIDLNIFACGWLPFLWFGYPFSGGSADQ